jgi:twitching motility two-component system response regulator PilH
MAETDRQTKILIVEDDQDQADAIRIMLEVEGYDTLHAPDAPKGLAMAREARPDLILLDVMMPTGTEGFHFVWDLRKDPDPQVKDVPIIVMTAIHEKTKLRFYPDQADPTYQPGEFLPVQTFLDKPVQSEELLREIKQVLGDK